MGHENPRPLEVSLNGWILHGPASGIYRRYAESLELHGDEFVLDFGGGCGALTRQIAHLLARGGWVTCLDLSPAWLEEARRRLGRLENMELIAGDLRQACLPAGAYDLAVIHFVLHDISPAERSAILCEVRRVLKPGGKLFLREPEKPGHGILMEEVQSLMNGAGFQELHAARSRLRLLGPVCEGVFRRPA